MPKQLIGNIGGMYLRNSKSVLFHPQQCEALESLTKVMVTGFVSTKVIVLGQKFCVIVLIGRLRPLYKYTVSISVRYKGANTVVYGREEGVFRFYT